MKTIRYLFFVECCFSICELHISFKIKFIKHCWWSVKRLMHCCVCVGLIFFGYFIKSASLQLFIKCHNCHNKYLFFMNCFGNGCKKGLCVLDHPGILPNLSVSFPGFHSNFSVNKLLICLSPSFITLRVFSCQFVMSIFCVRKMLLEKTFTYN